MTALALLAIVAWLPGAAAFRLPVLTPERRAALDAEERFFWAILISAAASLTIVLLLATFHRYSLARLMTADLLLALACAAFAWRGPRMRAARPRWTALIPVALASAAVAHFQPPSEYVIGGKDPGVYLNAGVQIAQRGTIAYHDPVVAAVPPFARDLFLPRDTNRPAFVAPRFMGFYVLDPDRGTVVSQFPHLFPASIAIGYGLGGLSGARWTVIAWGALGVVALYFLAARLFGRAAAAAGSLLLTLNVVQLWFARYPNAEVAMQALLLAALLATARAQVDGDDFFAPVAGGLLGLLLFLRIDVFVPLAGIAAAAAIGVIARRRLPWTFFAPVAAAAALLVPYALGPLHEYFARPILFVENLNVVQFAAVGSAAAFVVALVVIAGRRPAIAARVQASTPTVVAAVLLASAVYAYVFRQPVQGHLADYDAYSLRTFVAFYLTLPAFMAALIAIALTRPLFWRDPGFFLAFAAVCLFTFYKGRIVPEHFWAARRFVAMILPGALMLISAAAIGMPRGRRTATRLVSTAIGLVFLVLLGAVYARSARPVADHVEYQGVIAHLEQLAHRVGDRDLLIVESRDAGSDVHVFALPLAYIYSRNVLVLSNARPDKVTFAAFLNRAHAQYARVLFLGGGGTDLLSSRWSVTPIASERFQIPEYDSPWNAYPRFVRQKEFDYSLYVFAPPSDTPDPPDLDVGINDDLNVNRFHAKQETEGRTYRWSQRQSTVILNRIPADSRTIALWMSSGGRPPAAPPADVTILLNDVELGTVHVGDGFREYDVPVPPAVAAAAGATGEPVRVMLRTSTWNPAKLGVSGDDRDLGVMLDRVAVR